MSTQLADLTTFHDDELPEEELGEDPALGNAVVEGDDAEQEEQEEAQPETFEVQVKGDFGEDKTASVTLDDLRRGYMLQADYTRKTADLARQRDGVADALRQAVDHGRSQFVQQLETLRSAVLSTIEPELRNVDWQKLASEEPQEYMRLSARAQQLNGLLTQVEQQQRQATEAKHADHSVWRKEQIEKSRQTLISHIPEWSDQLYSGILSTVAQQYGFTLAEVGEVIDPRIIRLMSDVTKYHQGSDKRAIAKKQIAAAPKAVPGGVSQERGKVSNTMLQRAKRTGSITDAAAVLAARLNRPR